MDTLSLAHEFAGLAALEIIGHLQLAESEARETFQLVRECCTAAILGTVIRVRGDAGKEKQASK